MFEKILNDLEKAELTRFVENPVLFEAVKKVLLAGVYSNGVLSPGEPVNAMRNFALSLVTGREGVSNDIIGADLRACAEGIRVVEAGFNELKKFKAEDQSILSPLNEAR